MSLVLKSLNPFATSLAPVKRRGQMGGVRSALGIATVLTVALAGLAVRTARADDLAGYAQQVLHLVNKEGFRCSTGCSGATWRRH
jgi:hypothetical protein